MDISNDCMRINEDVLDSVRSQLGEGTGQSAPPAGSGKGSDASGSSWIAAAAEGTLAKVGAAAQAMSRRAEQASREMAKAEQNLSAREESLLGPTAGGKAFNKGGKGGKPTEGGKGQGYWSNKKRKWSTQYW